MILCGPFSFGAMGAGTAYTAVLFESWEGWMQVLLIFRMCRDKASPAMASSFSGHPSFVSWSIITFAASWVTAVVD